MFLCLKVNLYTMILFLFWLSSSIVTISFFCVWLTLALHPHLMDHFDFLHSQMLYSVEISLLLFLSCETKSSFYYFGESKAERVRLSFVNGRCANGNKCLQKDKNSDSFRKILWRQKFIYILKRMWEKYELLFFFFCQKKNMSCLRKV